MSEPKEDPLGQIKNTFVQGNPTLPKLTGES